MECKKRKKRSKQKLCEVKNNGVSRFARIARSLINVPAPVIIAFNEQVRVNRWIKSV